MLAAAELVTAASRMRVYCRAVEYSIAYASWSSHHLRSVCHPSLPALAVICKSVAMCRVFAMINIIPLGRQQTAWQISFRCTLPDGASAVVAMTVQRFLPAPPVVWFDNSSRTMSAQ